MRVSMRNMVMVCLALTFGILLAVPSVSAQGTNKQTPNKAELQQLYMSYLTYEEYKPEIDSDGDVRFKRDGKVYYIDVNEGDPESSVLFSQTFGRLRVIRSGHRFSWLQAMLTPYQKSQRYSLLKTMSG